MLLVRVLLLILHTMHLENLSQVLYDIHIRRIVYLLISCQRTYSPGRKRIYDFTQATVRTGTIFI